jgi:Cu/Ag efflux protein CusF
MLESLSSAWRMLAAALFATLLMLPAGCAKEQKATNRPTHAGKGTVVAVDAERGRVKIDHEEIKDYMDPMTMWFETSDPSLVTGLAAGDRVEFVVTEEASADLVTSIKKVP